jgi:Pyruvate/2-oxoglutarate dehydrogenase complex, dihydrolipoamide dehydrogenase (E3) component, and related enzymes
VGGGPAGIEAALQCSKRGDAVQLCTDGDMVGGLLHAAARAPFKENIAENIAAMGSELEQSSVQVRYGIHVDPAYIEKENPDFVIVATGSKPSVPPVPGINLSHVCNAQQLLMEEECFTAALGSSKTVVIGGGSVGLETALYLAQKSRLKEDGKSFLKDFAEEDIRKGLDCGSDITVIEMAEKPGLDLGGLRRTMLQLLKSYGVEIITGAVVEEIFKNCVRVRKNGESEFVDGDMVVLAAGYRSQGLPLVEWLETNRRYPYRVIGDAEKVGNIGKALLDAYEAACK